MQSRSVSEGMDWHGSGRSVCTWIHMSSLALVHRRGHAQQLVLTLLFSLLACRAAQPRPRNPVCRSETTCADSVPSFQNAGRSFGGLRLRELAEAGGTARRWRWAPRRRAPANAPTSGASCMHFLHFCPVLHPVRNDPFRVHTALQALLMFCRVLDAQTVVTQ